MIGPFDGFEDAQGRLWEWFTRKADATEKSEDNEEDNQENNNESCQVIPINRKPKV
jgi:hypothetical protein